MSTTPNYNFERFDTDVANLAPRLRSNFDSLDTILRRSAPVTIDATLAPYSALNDGTAQSTAALQSALDDAATLVGGIAPYIGVKVSGNFRFNSGSLIIPQGVSLVGAWTSTFGHTWIHDGAGQPSALDSRGTTFQIDVGAGSSSGAFITAYGNSLIQGISFYYPSQSRTAATPTVYPPTIFLGQDSSHTHFDQSVIDCEFIGAWLAIKARYGGRYLIKNPRGFPVNGIDIDKSYDQSWIVNPEFNAFWYSTYFSTPPADNYFKYVNQNGVGVKVGRVDQLTILNHYILGYFKGLETVITANEGSLPGGSAWLDVIGGGFENCFHGAYLTGGQEVGGIQFNGTRFLDTYDASGGGAGNGLTTTSTFGPNSNLNIIGGIFGSASNTQNYNLVLSGGGQVSVKGARFHNASIHNILANSLVGNPANIHIGSCVFNTSTLQSINNTGYGNLTSSANNFIQKNRSAAIISSGNGETISNGDRFLDFATAFGPVGVKGTVVLESGAVSFPENVEFTNGTNSFGVANIQGIANGASQGWGTFSVNAEFDRTTSEWNRGDEDAQAWLIIAESNTSDTGKLIIRHANSGANPITWTDFATLDASGWDSGGGGYTDEQAQDAVGSILTDSSTIDFVYDDSLPGIAALVKDDSITYAKIQNITATDKLLGRATAGAGDVEEIACTAAGRALLDDASAAAQRTTLGVETAPAFTAPTLTNSWVNYGSGYTDAGYVIHCGVVYLRGTIKNGTIGQSAFTLPAGYRPSTILVFTCNSIGALGILQVNADGTVVPAAGSNGSFSLEGARFIPS